MKLVTVMIVIQAILMIAALAATSVMMFRIKAIDQNMLGPAIFAANSLIFYIIVGLHGASLVLHGLSTFWCKGKN